MPEIYRADGKPAEPMPYKGWKARLEQWFLRRGMTRLGHFMGRWDERGLGR